MFDLKVCRFSESLKLRTHSVWIRALRQKVVCVRSESLREMVARNDITLHRDAETAKSLEKQSGPPPSTEVLGILLNRRWFETVPIWTNLEGSKWRERPPLSVWRMRAEIDRK